MKSKQIVSFVLAVSALFVTAPAFSGMSGVYEVQQDGCSNRTGQLKKHHHAIVIATDKNFEIVAQNYMGTTDEHFVAMTYGIGFGDRSNFKVGVERVDCHSLDGKCYDEYFCRFSENGNSVRLNTKYVVHAAQPDGSISDETRSNYQVNITLKDNHLEIVTPTGTCILSREVSLLN